tara:strand:- start:2445 stop:3863 length:1419 start_codon:yes stop_codon:yes gene_type:complete
MTKKKYRLTTCNICGSQAPANFMVRAQKEVSATSRNTVGGKEVIGSILGFQTSQSALARSLLTSRKRTHTTFRTVWMCESCSGQKSVGTREIESLESEYSNLLEQEERLTKDFDHLKSTRIPEKEDELRIKSSNTKKIMEAKQKLLVEVQPIFKDLRIEFDKIKKRESEKFVKIILENKSLISAIENSKLKIEIKKLTHNEKEKIQNITEKIQIDLDNEIKKRGTRWEDSKKIFDLKAKLEVKIKELHQNEKQNSLEKSARLNNLLLNKYLSREGLEEIFNDRYAEVGFNIKKNKFTLENFEYKKELLGQIKVPIYKKLFKSICWMWIIFFQLIFLSSFFSEANSEDILNVLGGGIVMVVPAVYAIFFSNFLKNPSKLHSKVAALLKKHLEMCLSKLETEIKNNSISFDFELFTILQKKFEETSKLEELSNLKEENCEKEISRDKNLLEDISNQLMAIRKRIKFIQETQTAQ